MAIAHKIAYNVWEVCTMTWYETVGWLDPVDWKNIGIKKEKVRRVVGVSAVLRGQLFLMFT